MSAALGSLTTLPEALSALLVLGHNSRVAPTVTLRDVARVAGVHPGTVSRALNGETRGLVNEETARRVLEVAAELGYRPNPIARGLKTNRSYTVRVLIPDLTNPLFPPVVRGIEDRLAEAGYTSLIASTENDEQRERIDFDAMRARQVDGFITATARLDDELLAEMAASGQRIVLVNRRMEDGSLPSVAPDDRMGIRLAVEHVVGLGHRQNRSCRRAAGPLDGTPAPPRVPSSSMRAAGLDGDGAPIRFSASVHGSRRRTRLPANCSTSIAMSRRSWQPTTLIALGCYDVLKV